MKILIIQENGRNKENRHLFLCHAMSYWLNVAGAETICWGPGHESYKSKFDDIVKKYDIILSMENYDTGWHPDLSVYKDKYKIFWSIDSHCVLREHIKLCKDNKINMHLNSTENYLNKFEFCEKLIWFPNAVDTRYYKKQNLTRDIDLGFCGSIISNRKQWLDYISRYFPVSVDRVIGDEMIKTINRYKVSLNKTIADDINYRIFENMACGTPVITNYVPSLEKLFNLDQDFLVYSNIKDLIGSINILLKDDALRNTIAESGYKTVLKNHTFEKRCQSLYEELKVI
jgi:hypothetical protein